MPKDRPRIIANFAITADGKVSTRNHTPSGFTSAQDKQRLRDIRSLGDAVMVGAGTVSADQMSMGLSDPALQKQRILRGQAREPIRVILSNSGRLDPKLKVFRHTTSPLVIFSTRRMTQATRARLAPHADLWLSETASVDLGSTLAILRKDYNVRTLVCEGGPTLFRALVEAGWVDELRITWAPIIFGSAQAPTLTGLPGSFLPTLIRCRLLKKESDERELFLTYKVLPATRAAP